MTTTAAVSWQSVDVSRILAGKATDKTAGEISSNANASDSTDEIVIRVPASTDYCRLAQVSAASIALRQRMSSADIEELRAAVVQASELLAESTGEHGAVIEFVFRTHQDFLEMQAHRSDKAEPRFKRRFNL